MRRGSKGAALLVCLVAVACLAGCSAFVPTKVSEALDTTRITEGEHAWPSPVADASQRGMASKGQNAPQATATGEGVAETAQDDPPLLPLSGIRIGIDPGHQARANTATEPEAPGSSVMKAKSGLGVYGVSTGVSDSVINLSVSLKLRDLLVAKGAEVVMTRETDDVDLSNVDRASIMNEAGVDLAVRVFCNADEDPSVAGALMLVPSGPHTESIEDASRAAGRSVLNAYLLATGARNLGIRDTDTQTMFNWSQVPIINLGMGQLTNAAEDQRLASDEYQQRAAQGISQGILNYFAS